jgi:excisionase family DNA binding protein
MLAIVLSHCAYLYMAQDPTLAADCPPRRLLKIEELSALWSVPKATLYNWVNQGRLPYVKLGRSLRFDVVQIEEFREQRTMGMAGKR